jgi:tetratricopeptide (TPR) repeat protein
MFHCAASYAANQQPASPKAPAAPAKSAPPQQQPASPPSQQPPASQEPSPTVQAIQVLRAEIAIDSLDPRLRYELANALHDAGDKEEALLQYDKALSLKPDLKEALVNRGAVLNELGRVVEAIDSFEKALALAPRDTKALVNLGNSLYALQRYDEAIKRYKLSVAADSTFGEGYYYVGIAFADAGIYREAVREWERILVVAPNSEAAKNARENLDTLKNFLTSEVKPGTRPKME